MIEDREAKNLSQWARSRGQTILENFHDKAVQIALLHKCHIGRYSMWSTTEKASINR